MLLRADVTDARITEIELASRYGNVTIVADGFVDASGDAAALSSVRVMGPCAAMGAGAAHALDLAGRAACTTSTWTGCAAGWPRT